MLLLLFGFVCTDLDHTADVQCHAWGADMKAAFENMAPCMLNYMTDLALISIDESKSTHLEVTGAAAIVYLILTSRVIYVHVFILL